MIVGFIFKSGDGRLFEYGRLLENKTYESHDMASNINLNCIRMQLRPISTTTRPGLSEVADSTSQKPSLAV